MEREQMRKEIKDWLYQWVANNFGDAEADDPSWSIEAIAQDMAGSTLMNEIYNLMERMWQRQDCEDVADEMGVELTEAQKDCIVDEFITSEQYVCRPTHIWKEIIQYELELAKRKEQDG